MSSIIITGLDSTAFKYSLVLGIIIQFNTKKAKISKWRITKYRSMYYKVYSKTTYLDKCLEYYYFEWLISSPTILLEFRTNE